MTAWAFRGSVFLGAFLLFLIQPLIGKRILPWFGGGPSVWTTTLVFFQLALIVGYAYAHVSRRLPGQARALGHVSLLVVGLLTIGVLPGADWKPVDATAPAARVLLLLAAHVGLPFVLLAATAPLLQDWHARIWPARSPYQLYAISNIGSLLALIVYPLVLERYLSIGLQARTWSGVFALFVVTCAWCGWRVAQLPPAPAGAADAGGPGPRLTLADHTRWILLSATGSGLLVATTSQLTQNVAAVPLLWVVPMALYLATFIAAFADRYARRFWAVAAVLAIGSAASVLRGAAIGSLPTQAGILLAAMTAGCMVCHGELARLKPAAARLTTYYLAIAIGGGVGGLFVGQAAPALFTSYVEVPLLYLLVVGLAARVWYLDRSRRAARRASRVRQMVLTALVGAAGVALLVRGPDPFRTVASTRNFYGTLSVVDDPPGARQAVRRLFHGQILHGLQYLDPARALQPTAYYVPGSGLALAMTEHPRRAAGGSLTIGVLGLGAGSIAAWGRRGDRLRFFEIDPSVVDYAARYFTYLDQTAAAVDVVTGDGRLSLEREVASGEGVGRYDLLVLDAFAGDAVPVHLLTREAFDVYRRALRADGILAVNVSNRYLDLRPVVRGLAGEIGHEVREVRRAAEPAIRATRSTWLLATSGQAFLERYPQRSTDRRHLVWTDDFSSLWSVLQ